MAKKPFHPPSRYRIDGHIFTRKGKQLHRTVGEMGETWTWANADLKCSDGTLFDAILLFCESDGGEHYETLIITPNGLARQGDPDFLSQIRKTKSEFFPYKFRLRIPLAYDHHPTDEKGWRQ